MSAAADKYRNATDHAVPLTSGRVIGPGEDAPIDLDAPHDKQLVDDGSLILTDKPKKETSK